MFLERHKKTKLMPASFSYFLELLWSLQSLCTIKKLIKLFYLHCSYKKEVQISRKNSNKENLKVIKNTLPNISGNPESIKN